MTLNWYGPCCMELPLSYVCRSVGRITFCHLPFQTKWVYVGTDQGNVHVVNIETNTLSGYAIMWNKAIEL